MSVFTQYEKLVKGAFVESIRGRLPDIYSLALDFCWGNLCTEF
jgi:hypothetical protein